MVIRAQTSAVSSDKAVGIRAVPESEYLRKRLPRGWFDVEGVRRAESLGTRGALREVLIRSHSLESMTTMKNTLMTASRRAPTAQTLRLLFKAVFALVCFATGVSGLVAPAHAADPTTFQSFVVRDAKTGGYTGAFSDLCRRFGEDVLKVKVTFVDTTWDNMIAGLQTDKWDLAMAINRTPVREQVINFSTAVVRNDTNFVYSRSDAKVPKQIKTVADIDKPDLIVAVVQGTTDDKAISRGQHPPRTHVASCRFSCRPVRCQLDLPGGPPGLG